MERSQYDIVIIGSGLAGLSAALEGLRAGSKVLIVTQYKLGQSNTLFAQGGIQAAIGRDDSAERHARDTLSAGGQDSSPQLVETMTRHANGVISELQHFGVRFDQSGSALLLKQCAGTSRPRVLSCGDRIGVAIMGAMLKAVRTLSPDFLEDTEVSEIEKVPGGFRLTLAGKRRADKSHVQARSVILATGGGGKGHASDCGELSTNNFTANSSGLALARRTGLHIQKEDLYQYHPTCIVSPAAYAGRPAPETMRSMGAELLNADLEPFVDPLLPRQELSRAINAECDRGRGAMVEGKTCVWLNTPGIDAGHGHGTTKRLFPAIHKIFLRMGQDITRTPIPVRPAIHYFLGGVTIDSDTRTSIPGIFAAGEITTGVHGRERLMGNALLDAMVFGSIAGRNASLYAKEQ